MRRNRQHSSRPARQIDDDRERFLKELKSQAFALHTQVNAAATFRCVLQHQHSGATEPAAVCHTCYGEVRQQADRLEAALHMDAKEAAKIVYEAVWADTSDPNRTYLNAATALLSELRKRAGIGPSARLQSAPRTLAADPGLLTPLSAIVWKRGQSPVHSQRSFVTTGGNLQLSAFVPHLIPGELT